MYKNILIPTDFSVRSLGLLKVALSEHVDQKVNIVFCHGVHLSSSLTDMMFFSKRKLIQSLLTTEFRAALEVIKNKYESQIGNISVEPFTGFNQSAFDNYLEGHQIQEAYVCYDFKCKLDQSKSFDVTPFVLKMRNRHLIALDHLRPQPVFKESFADLFFQKSRYGGSAT